jgi:hypothetical protein
MQSNRARSLRAVLFALVIGVTGASPALAAQTSSGVSETYTIAASISVSNVPSTGTFASPPACVGSNGCLPSDFSYAFTSTIGSNNGTGLTVAVRATTLTSGSNVIPLSARGVVYGTATGFTRALPDGTNLGSLSPTVDLVLGSTATQGSIDLGIEPLLRLDPTAYPAGSYTGTFEVRASTNP